MTASRIVFDAILGETGIVNLIVKPDLYERHCREGKLDAPACLERSGSVCVCAGVENGAVGRSQRRASGAGFSVGWPP